MKTKIEVTGMRCAGCEALVSEALEEIDGVEKVVASHEKGTIEIDYDDSTVELATIKAVIESQGFHPRS